MQPIMRSSWRGRGASAPPVNCVRRKHRTLRPAGALALLGSLVFGCGGSHSHDVTTAAEDQDERAEEPQEEAAETAAQEQAEEAEEASARGAETAGAEAVAQDTVDERSPAAAESGGEDAGSSRAGMGGARPSTAGRSSAGGSQSSAGSGGSAGTVDAPMPSAMPPIAGVGGSSGPGTSAVPALSLAEVGKPVAVATNTSFRLAESPLWDPCSHQLLFVDVSASVIYALSHGDALTVLAKDTQNTNGIAFAPDGTLILAQMARPGHIARRDKSGQITALTLSGPALHTPDDVIVRSDGTIYFSDGEFPPVGTLNLGPLAVYGIAPGSSTLDKGGTVNGPNGIELSPDERTLYVSGYYEGSVIPFAVAPDGKLSKGTALATGLTNPDSMCLDAAGNLYVAVSSGLQVLRPDGSRVGVISVRSTQGTTNCTFGGDDGKTLYITAWTTLWKITNMPIHGLDWEVNQKRLGCN